MLDFPSSYTTGFISKIKLCGLTFSMLKISVFVSSGNSILNCKKINRWRLLSYIASLLEYQKNWSMLFLHWLSRFFHCWQRIWSLFLSNYRMVKASNEEENQISNNCKKKKSFVHYVLNWILTGCKELELNYVVEFQIKNSPSLR